MHRSSITPSFGVSALVLALGACGIESQQASESSGTKDTTARHATVKGVFPVEFKGASYDGVLPVEFKGAGVPAPVALPKDFKIPPSYADADGGPGSLANPSVFTSGTCYGYLGNDTWAETTYCLWPSTCSYVGDGTIVKGCRQVLDEELGPLVYVGYYTLSEKGNVPLVNHATSATATADSTAPGYAAAKVNDGDLSTATDPAHSWTNNHSGGGYLPQALYLTWTDARSFNKIEVFTSADYPIKEYDVQSWTGTAWRTLAQVTGNTSARLTHSFPVVTATRVRVLAKRGPDKQPAWARINELTVTLVPNLARESVATASSTAYGYAAGRTVDGDTRQTAGGDYSWTNDHSAGGVLPQALVLTWHAPRTIGRVDLITSSGLPIQIYDLQYLNGSTWTTLQSVTGNTALVRSHSFTPITTSQIRVVAKRGPEVQPAWARINEFEAY